MGGGWRDSPHSLWSLVRRGKDRLQLLGELEIEGSSQPLEDRCRLGERVLGRVGLVTPQVEPGEDDQSAGLFVLISDSL